MKYTITRIARNEAVAISNLSVSSFKNSFINVFISYEFIVYSYEFIVNSYEFIVIGNEFEKA